MTPAQLDALVAGAEGRSTRRPAGDLAALVALSNMAVV